MCGITGIIAKRAFNPAALEAMTARLVHRGPDGEGHWISSDGCVGFGQALAGQQRIDLRGSGGGSGGGRGG